MSEINYTAFADELLGKIDKRIDERINNLPCFYSGIVDNINIDGTVDVYFPPNKKSIFTKIQNQSIYELSVGDSVEIIAPHGNLSNCWICARHKK